MKQPKNCRLNNYDDPRFEEEVLKQHGAFVVDDQGLCAFGIFDKTKALVKCDEGIDIDLVIDEFRIYAEHVTEFYDANLKVIKKFESLELFKLDIMDIQPSQFVIDENKVWAIESFIENEEDLIIPLAKINDSYVACDGHTRLYYAYQLGIGSVYGFMTKADDYLEDFVDVARRKGVNLIRDLRMVSHETYKQEWHGFCDAFF